MENKILKNLAESIAAGCSTIGAIENALASAINSADNEGGYSVKIEKNEIWIFQSHSDKEFSFKF